MKIIYPEKQTDVSATSFDPEYPAIFLLNNVPSKKWMADSNNTATLTVTIASGSNAIAIFGTNAESAVITAKDSGGGTVKTDTFALAGTRTYDRCWMEYTQQDAIHSATIALTAAAGRTVEAGIVRAGNAVAFKNPNYGLGESRKDFSIVKELNNGALYIKKRNIVRTFSVKVDTTRETDFYNFSDIADYYGPNPFACLLADDILDSQWCVFGHILSAFSGGHANPFDSTISFNIQEAV